MQNALTCVADSLPSRILHESYKALSAGLPIAYLLTDSLRVRNVFAIRSISDQDRHPLIGSRSVNIDAYQPCLESLQRHIHVPLVDVRIAILVNLADITNLIRHNGDERRARMQKEQHLACILP